MVCGLVKCYWWFSRMVCFLLQSFTVHEEPPGLKSCYDWWLFVCLDVKPHVYLFWVNLKSCYDWWLFVCLDVKPRVYLFWVNLKSCYDRWLFVCFDVKPHVYLFWVNLKSCYDWWLFVCLDIKPHVYLFWVNLKSCYDWWLFVCLDVKPRLFWVNLKSCYDWWLFVCLDVKPRLFWVNLKSCYDWWLLVCPDVKPHVYFGSRCRSLASNISEVPYLMGEQVCHFTGLMVIYRCCYTAACRLMTIPLITSLSYNRNFLKKISFHTTIETSLMCHLEVNYDILLNKPCL
jgi:hypothetical protein